MPAPLPALDQLYDRVRDGEDGLASVLDACVSADPADGRARLLRSLLRFREDQLPGAIHDASTAAKLRPGYISADNEADRLALMAVELRLQQLQKRAESPEDRFELGRMLATAGRWAEALVAYEAVLGQGQNDAMVLTAMGLAQRVLGETKRAVMLHRKAIGAAPKMALAHNNLASALVDLDDMGEARVCAERATEIDPSMGSAFISIASGHLLRGETRATIETAAEGEVRDPSLVPEGATLRAAAHLIEDRFPSALEAVAAGVEHERAHKVLQLKLVQVATLSASARDRDAATVMDTLWALARLP